MYCPKDVDEASKLLKLINHLYKTAEGKPLIDIYKTMNISWILQQNNITGNKSLPILSIYYFPSMTHTNKNPGIYRPVGKVQSFHALLMLSISFVGRSQVLAYNRIPQPSLKCEDTYIKFYSASLYSEQCQEF